MQENTAYRRRFPLHPLYKLRRGSSPFAPPLVERCLLLLQPACRGSSTLSNILDILPTRFAAAKAAPVAAPCSGCGCRKPPRHRALHDPQRRGIDVPGGVGAAIAQAPRLCAYRRSPCLAKPSIPPSRLAPRGAFHFVHLCTLPTRRKGRGKPSAARKLKPSGFPLSPLRHFGAGASSTA